MINKLPLVTVIAGCYNHERFVEECLESIRTQTYPNIQLIIMDDCSHDNSTVIIQKWMAKHNVECAFIAHQKNMGFPKTLNEALAFAKGKYVSIIAADDVWLPNFILRYVEEINSRSHKYGVVYGNSFRIDENSYDLPGYRKRIDYHPEGNIFLDLVRETFIATNAVLIKRELIEEVGLYDESLIFEDFDMWTKLAEVCRFAYCPEILAKYRIVSSSMVRSFGNEITVSYLKILSRILASHPETKPLVENRKVDIASNLYKINYPRSYLYLLKSYSHKSSKKRLFQVIMAFLGINFKTCNYLIEKTRKLLRGNKIRISK